jgi:hypothetical protein
MARALTSAARLDRLGNVCQRVSSVSVSTAWPIMVLTVGAPGPERRPGGGDGVHPVAGYSRFTSDMFGTQ